MSDTIQVLKKPESKTVYPPIGVHIDRIFYRFICKRCLFENVETTSRYPVGSIVRCHVCGSAFKVSQ